MKFYDALILLKESLLAEFSDLWHHKPMIKQDVNGIALVDTTRSEKDFTGMFFAPYKTNESALSVGVISNVPTLETKSDDGFRQNDIIENENGDKYQISSIRNTTRQTVILELKVIRKT